MRCSEAYLSRDAISHTPHSPHLQAIYAMQRGMVLFKYNAGKGLFGKKSDGARIVPRFVQV